MSSIMIPKMTNKGFGKLVRLIFLKKLENEWGSYESLRGYLYKFSNWKKVLTLYSRLNNNNVWWYGVSKLYLSKWDDKISISLLMRDGYRCDYVMLDPIESIKLLNKSRSYHCQ